MKKYTWRLGVLEIVMILIGLIFASPIFILINVAFKPKGDGTSPLQLSPHPTIQNFGDAIVGGYLINALLNTSLIVVLSLIVLIATSSLASYAIARLTSRWSKIANYAFLLGLLLPYQLATIPLYQAMNAAGLLGTIWGLVLFYSAILMPFSVFLYVAFLRALPLEYEEAAQVDGAGPFTTFVRIVFPMLRAVTGTIVIINTINIWNDFFTPQLYLSGTGVQTVTVSLYNYVGQYGSQWSLIFGGLIVASIPILVMFFFLQKYVIQGFAGGLKG